ncbi:uncharacterized protein METZ01_LOCUS434354 [marine metagenome]|uniref:DUF456 domain-containing protein n=1 Tax=marine metagenome TaxID=408172 RepID=A0A382YEI3_9ZZZZ
MDTLFIIITVILLCLGVAGSLVPGIPGPPLAYASILILHLFTNYNSSKEFLMSWGIIVIVVSFADNWMQVYGVKKFGGSKKAVIGSILGLFAGIIIPIPFGFIIGPLFGAFIGALLESGNEITKAIKIAAGSFIGLLTGTILKLAVSLYLVIKYITITLFNTA